MDAEGWRLPGLMQMALGGVDLKSESLTLVPAAWANLSGADLRGVSLEARPEPPFSRDSTTE